MEALIKPEFGLAFWTIAIFIVLVALLSKTAWKPLIKAVEERERALRRDREAAEKARAEAERIKAELDARLAAMKAEVEARLAEAREEGEKERERIIEHAMKNSEAMLETAKNELEAQKNRLSGELRDSVAALALQAAEKLLLKNLDHKADRELVDRFLKELEAKDIKHKHQ